MRSFYTKFGIYKCGTFQSTLDAWYGKMEGNLLKFITKKEFDDAIKLEKKPDLDPLPF